MAEGDSDEELRAQLIEARIGLSRQIEVIEGSYNRRWARNDEIIAELRRELADVENALARLDGEAPADGADTGDPRPFPDWPDPSPQDHAAAANVLIDGPKVRWGPWALFASVLVLAILAAAAFLLARQALQRPQGAPQTSGVGYSLMSDRTIASAPSEL